MRITRTRLSRVKPEGECPAEPCSAPGDEGVFITETERETLVVECDCCAFESREYDISGVDGSVIDIFENSYLDISVDGYVTVDGRALSDVDGIDIFDPNA